MPITTKVERSNPIHGEVYLIKQCDKVNCQLLATGLWFSPVSSTNTTKESLNIDGGENPGSGLRWAQTCDSV
jgi:hypothetical protein